MRGSQDSVSCNSATGIVWSAWNGLQLVCVPTIDDVKSSGAVSPATRATASTVPVRTPPIVCGSTIESVVRQRGTPRRSEERRVGKECRSRWWPYHEKKKKKGRKGHCRTLNVERLFKPNTS